MSRNIDRWVRQMREMLDRLEVPSTVEETFGQYAADPVAFATDLLDVKTLPEYQEAFLRSVVVDRPVQTHKQTGLI